MISKLIGIAKLIWKLVVCGFSDAIAVVLPAAKKSIQEDIILITGGGSGLGRCIALNIANYHPKHIILWGRTVSTLSQTAKDVQELGINCSFMVCDVSSREQIYSLAREVEARFGHVTMLVNNAGVVNGSSVLDCDPEVTELTFRTNVLSHFWTIKAFLPGMLKQKRGHIVTMSSMLGWAGINGASDYCSSKFASSGLTEALRDEFAVTGISDVKLTAVYPYHVDNNMFAGVTTRFPFLFPSLKEDYVTEKIVEGILTNRCKILVPKLMYIIALFYSIAPISAVVSIMKFLDVNKAMDQYHDHKHKAASQS